MYASRSNYHRWNFEDIFNSCNLHCKRFGGADKAAILWFNNAYHPKSTGQEVFAATCSNTYFGRLFLKVCCYSLSFCINHVQLLHCLESTLLWSLVWFILTYIAYRRIKNADAQWFTSSPNGRTGNFINRKTVLIEMAVLGTLLIKTQRVCACLPAMYVEVS